MFSSWDGYATEQPGPVRTSWEIVMRMSATWLASEKLVEKVSKHLMLLHAVHWKNFYAPADELVHTNNRGYAARGQVADSPRL